MRWSTVPPVRVETEVAAVVSESKDVRSPCRMWTFGPRLSEWVFETVDGTSRTRPMTTLEGFEERVLRNWYCGLG
jgi:hypothetical protein